MKKVFCGICGDMKQTIERPPFVYWACLQCDMIRVVDEYEDEEKPEGKKTH
jgi:hypothetical protein